MTWKNRVCGLVGIAMLACLAAGCDDGEGDELTPEEAAALAELIGVSVVPVAGQSLVSLLPDGSGAAAAGAGGSIDYDFDKPCAEGGSVNLSGTADYEIGSDVKTVDIDGTVAFHNCAETTDDGDTYTLTGSIDHLLRMAISWSDGSYRIKVDGTADGSVGWERDDGSSGVCEVDVTIDATFEVDAKNWTWEAEGGVTGTVCGISVDADAKDWTKKGWA